MYKYLYSMDKNTNEKGVKMGIKRWQNPMQSVGKGVIYPFKLCGSAFDLGKKCGTKESRPSAVNTRAAIKGLLLHMKIGSLHLEYIKETRRCQA